MDTINAYLEKSYDEINAGNFAIAEALLLQALKKFQHIMLYNTLAFTYIKTNRLELAIETLNQSLALDNNNPIALNNLANIYAFYENFDLASQLYLDAIKIAPEYQDAYNNYAALLYKYKDYRNALIYVDKSLEINILSSSALYNKAAILHAIKDDKAALDIINGLLMHNQSNTQYKILKAEILRNLNNDNAALKLLLDCDASGKDFEIKFIIALIYKKQGKSTQAIKILEALYNEHAAIALLGDIIECALNICAWDIATEYTQKLNNILNNYLIQTATKYASNLDMLDPSQALLALLNPRLQKSCAIKWCEHYYQHVPEAINISVTDKIKGKIRVGYISPDFSNHPIGLLIEPILKTHNRDVCVPYILPTVMHNDSYYNNICQAGEVIPLYKMAFNERVLAVKEAQLDIIIDLCGHYDYDNLLLLKEQLAGVQAHWLGYMSTLGADFIKYYIADAVIANKFSEYFTETIVELPQIIATKFKPVELTHTKKSLNLPEDKFIFFSSCNTYRLNQACTLAWSEILRNCPNAILWLTCSDLAARNNIYDFFKKQGVEKQLVFTQKFTLSQTWVHALSDLMLDQFALSAGTSALLAFWARVPVLTIEAMRPTVSLCNSFYHAAQNFDLVAKDIADYINIAIKLANNQEYYHNIKAKALANIGVLYNLDQFMPKLEAAYKAMLMHYSTRSTEKIIKIN